MHLLQLDVLELIISTAPWLSQKSTIHLFLNLDIHAMTAAVTAYSSRKLIDGLFSAMKTGFHESYIQDPSQNPPSPKVFDASV